MKKSLIPFVAVFISLSLLQIPVSASSDLMKNRKEIIVKYTNETELTTNIAINAIKQKLKPQKLERKKIIAGSHSKLELLETGADDDVNYIAEALSKEENVEFAVPNHKITLSPVNYRKEPKKPNDPMFKKQWGLQNTGQSIEKQKGTLGIDIDILKAWQITKGSPNVVVGVLDTGIDINHNDLNNKFFINKLEESNNAKDNDENGYTGDLNGWDFANDDNTVFDDLYEDSHGTHVTGIIAAESGNSIGVSGVAPNIKILPLKFISFDGGYIADAIEAIEYAEKLGVKIINCSWSGPEYNEALKYTIENSDILFVCAAGNNTSDISMFPVYPASYDLPNVISVAAVNNNGGLCSFSNYGSKVNVAAPGEKVISTLPNNQYAFEDGTSMAAPFVTGIAALLKSYNSKLTPEQMKNIIINNGKKINQLTDYVGSGGIVNAYLTLSSI